MAYTPTTWVTGDDVTATRMNKIENGIAGAGGYDAVVYIYHDNNSSHDYVAQIVSGNFASLSAMIEESVPPNILVRIWDDLQIYRGSSSLIAVYYVNSSLIDFRIKIPTFNTGSSNAVNIIVGGVLTWFSDDTVAFNW